MEVWNICSRIFMVIQREKSNIMNIFRSDGVGEFEFLQLCAFPEISQLMLSRLVFLFNPGNPAAFHQVSNIIYTYYIHLTVLTLIHASIIQNFISSAFHSPLTHSVMDDTYLCLSHET